MTYWRMQLHPDDATHAVQHAVKSLAAGFIGLGFLHDPGDLMLVNSAALQRGEKDYVEFARRMAIGDKVLIIVHHFPFALVTIAGDYNYVRRPEPEIGVWFNHFRRVSDVKYYGDWVTNAHDWQPLTMTDTISILDDPHSQSYRLI